MDNAYRLFSTDRTGKRTELTELARAVSWSGNAKTVARQVNFSLLQTARDLHQPVINCPLGAAAELTVGSESVFGGVVLSCGEDSLGFDSDRTAWDWGYYLKQNSDYYVVNNQTPEAVATALAETCGFELGDVAETGVKLTRNFLPGDYYTILRTLYALATAQTGIHYRLRFRGPRLDVVELVQTEDTLLLVPGSNLISVRKTDIAQQSVNRVKIYDASRNLIGTAEDEESQALYGVFQAAINKDDYDDPQAAAEQLLADGAPTSTLVCECLGSRRLITGNTCIIREPVTGANGLFYITSDTHTWAKGVYKTKVTLDLKDLVSEADAALAAKE